MTFWIGLFLGCSGSAWAATHRQRVELSLPCCLMGNALLLYWFAVFHLLNPGVWILVGLNAACWIPALRRIIAEPTVFRDNFCTPSLAAFLFWSALLYYANADRMFYDWDEFSHWGLVAKAIFEKGDLPCRFHELLNFPSYPPGMALMQYFYVRIPGVFAEDAVLFASSQFIASLMMFGLYFVRWRDWKLNTLYLMLIWLIPLVFFEYFYSVYVDGILAMLFAFALFLILTTGKMTVWRTVLLAVTLGFLVLVKASGTGLAVIALLTLGAMLLVRRTEYTRSEKLLAIGVPLAALLSSKLSWKLLVAANGCPVAFSGNRITPAAIYRAVVENQPDHAHAVIAAWAKKLLLHTPAPQVDLTPGVLFILAGLSALAFFLAGRSKTLPYLRRGLIAAGILIPLAGILFAVTLLIYYIFDFTRYEALILASFDRYMNTIALAGYMLVLAMAMSGVSLLRPRPRRFKIAILLLLLIPFLAWPRIDRRWGNVLSRNYCYLRGPQMLGEQQWREALTSGKKIALLAQGSKGTEAFILRYTAFGHAVSLPWSVGEPQFPGDIWTEPRTPEEFARELAPVDYVFIYRTNDYFRRRYAELFHNPQEIFSGRLYRRDKNGKLHLLPVAKLELSLRQVNFLQEFAGNGAQTAWVPGAFTVDFPTPDSNVELEIQNAAALESVPFRRIRLFYRSDAPVGLQLSYADGKAFSLELPPGEKREQELILPPPREALKNIRMNLSAKKPSRFALKRIIFLEN